MEFKGTKGKWVKSKKLPDYIEPRGSRTEIYSESNANYWIAKIQDNGGIKGKEGKANALLISKAPEMLDLLQRMYDEYSTNDRISGSLREYMIQANKLLKEATEI